MKIHISSVLFSIKFIKFINISSFLRFFLHILMKCNLYFEFFNIMLVLVDYLEYMLKSAPRNA